MSGPNRNARCTFAVGMKIRARGRTDVTSRVPMVFDEVAGGPAVAVVQLNESFSGDIQGEGTARVVQATRADGSATFAGIERVRGALAGRNGTFLLQVQGTVAGSEVHAEWFVVGGSGTGGLAGLRGEGGFTAELGEHGTIWLDYSFDSDPHRIKS